MSNSLTESEADYGHVPVLLQEVVDLLQPQHAAVILDGTVGTGGHAFALLKHAPKTARLIGLDLDPGALQQARHRLLPLGDRVTLVSASYADAPAVLRDQGIESVSCVLLDLGLSSLELASSGRGFSFQQLEDPLDMRFDPQRAGPTAADLLNHRPQQELIDILRDYGEERQAKQLAKAFCLARKSRPFVTVGDLVDCVIAVLGPKRSKLHPATRTFQAPRIAVNDELGTLQRAVPQLIELLTPGGRIGIISFHSLEDRIVKTIFKQAATGCVCPPQFPECRCDHVATLTLTNKHVVVASREEEKRNPRSRSAKLRVAEKIFPQQT